MKKILTIGVMGPGPHATPEEIALSEKIGAIIAKTGHYLLTGGSNTGVMNGALKGAKDYDPNAKTIAILSHNGEEDKTSPYADVCIPTGMGEGRNYMNIRSCDIVIFCCNDVYKSAGTFSEFNFTTKHRKPVIFITTDSCFWKKWNRLLNDLCEEDQYEDQMMVADLGILETVLLSMISCALLLKASS